MPQRTPMRPILAVAALGVAAVLWATSGAPAAETRTCLSGSDAQAVVYAGQARRLSELRGAIEGELIRADLCRDGASYIYVVTTLGANGKVTRRLVDADPVAAAPARPAVAAPLRAVPVRPVPATD